MRILFLFLFLLLDSPCILVFAFWTMLEIERRARAGHADAHGSVARCVVDRCAFRRSVRFASGATVRVGSFAHWAHALGVCMGHGTW